MGYKETFVNIYENYGFGGDESRSGSGSTLNETEKLRQSIINLFNEKNIKSVVDIPCGDFNWMKEIVPNFTSYKGGDIVDQCVIENTEKYGSSDISFFQFDILTDEIPNGDVLIVRDIIGHFPISDGEKIINNILQSDCKFLLSTTWYNINDDDYYIHHYNRGADYGRFYPVNLMSQPFNFPKPDHYIEEDVRVDGFEKGNRKVLALWDMEKVKKHFNIQNVKKIPKINITNKELTVVTGLWNIGRTGRDFSHYIDNFRKFLDIPNFMFILIPKEYEYLVWEKRTTENTYVKIYELDDVKNMYSPFWDKTQEIRTNPKWFNFVGENGWLANSPQASLEWYNPIVQSKMFLLNDVTIWNPFNTEYFIWLDAGITNTVYEKTLTEDRALDKLIPFLDNFLFLSYPYEANTEIHGFEYGKMNQYAGEKVKYVCRGGLFGGSKSFINNANATYYSTLNNTLNEGLMGTEESIFSIMSYREPNIYRRYALTSSGLIGTFIADLLDDKVVLEPIDEKKVNKVITQHTISKVKTNLYILTFNFPQQLQHTINSMEKTPEWLEKPHLVLLDNSTDENAKKENKVIAEKYNFEYIDMGGNTGICGGRQRSAEHFHESDADFMFFFEDDMTVNPPELQGEFCRNGFRKYIPNLYETLHKIMLKDDFDFLKLSFTEVYFDNDKALPWYNTPQHIRTRDWPDYDKLPITGLDPNCPLAEYKHVMICDGVSYLTGVVNYANWPMIVSKSGNKKMFIDTKWGHPFEQTWSSHIYQLIKQDLIKPAILLASPIWHDRIKYYKPEERREN